MLPLSEAGQIGQMVHPLTGKGISLLQPGAAGRGQEAVQSGECGPLSAVRAAYWELERWDWYTWDYLKPDRVPFAAVEMEPLGWEGPTQPPAPTGLGGSAKEADSPKNPAGCISVRETARGTPKGPT